jgi:hypothetical protein
MIIGANYEEGEPNEWIDKARCLRWRSGCWREGRLGEGRNQLLVGYNHLSLNQTTADLIMSGTF